MRDALASLALAGCALQLTFLRAELRARAGCICRKGAWHPDCPVHGRSRS